MSPENDLSKIEDIADAFSVEDYLYFYRDFLPPERSDVETEAAIQQLHMFPPMRVLDLACGFGRIANRLAAQGFRVTGVEYVAGFLDIARQQAAQMGLEVDYVHADMRRISYDAEFNRVILMFNSFGYFSDEENLLVMKNIARALKPGGRLGLDVAHRDGTLANFQPDSVYEKEGDWMINRFSFDVWTGRLLNERVIIRQGQRRDRPFSIRLYSLTEMRSLLEACGLVLENAYGEWDARPLELESQAMVLIARKPE